MEIIPIESAVLFQVQGKDAERYLNARLTQNIKTLLDGESREYAALSSMGKVMSYGLVKKISSQEFFLLTDGGDPEEQRKIISQFIVADRVAVTPVHSRHYHIRGKNHSIDDSIVTFNSTRYGVDGIDISVNTEFLHEEILNKNLYEAERIRAGRASYPFELNEKTFLSEWSRSKALCFGKGCYVGQETVEKIDAVGTTPKRIVLLVHGDRYEINPGEKILSKDGEMLGVVLSSGSDSKGTALFGRITNEEFKSFFINQREFLVSVE